MIERGQLDEWETPISQGGIVLDSDDPEDWRMTDSFPLVMKSSIPLWEGGAPHLQVTPSGGLRYGGCHGSVPTRIAHGL